eukprot:TRINITY_DN1660_c0_g1_i1.p3 TRINITY_DN1660_c0_g1~~TRINITY_DN1660_c0_g1_i1.p3  ORF type:complete len:133 (+),score=17.56 TRINITY_DN1660_c0_g1_i1:28-426(+)
MFVASSNTFDGVVVWLAEGLFFICFFFFLMIRRPPRSTHCISSAASDVYKRQYQRRVHGASGKQNQLLKQEAASGQANMPETTETSGFYIPKQSFDLSGLLRAIFASGQPINLIQNSLRNSRETTWNPLLPF